MNRGSRRRRGYILIVVLGLTVVVTTLGIAFLSDNSTVMPEAMNRMAATRARYLAESGAALATHFLMYPPTTVSSNNFWTGATGIAIDATNDYTDVTVAQDVTDPRLFSITSIGVALDPDNSIRGKQQVTAQVIVPSDGKWHLPYGLLGMSMVVPATVTVAGDVHANGNLMGWGKCHGNVSATGMAMWPGTGPPASITSNAPAVTRPPANPALYPTYNIHGTSYTAYSYGKLTMGATDVNTLNAINMSATNPGRIIMAPVGDLILLNNVNLNGTLVVQGNLWIDVGVQLTAISNYPALVVTGDILFNNSNATAQIVGSVICGGAIRDNNMSNVSLRITGALVVSGGFNFQLTDGTYVFTWDPQWSVFWNFAKSGTRDPITVLNWTEN